MVRIKYRIKRHEVGIVFREGDFDRLLEPGTYRFWDNMLPPRRQRVEIFDTLKTRFDHELIEVLVKEEALADRLNVVDLAENERALVWRNGRLLDIRGPGLHAYWKEPARLEVERFDVEDVRFRHVRAQAVIEHPEASKHLVGSEIEQHEDALLVKDGRIVERLEPGKHIFWRAAGKTKAVTVDGRERTLDVQGQEIMTQDKVTLRLNLVVVFRVRDAEKATLEVSDYEQATYREAQLLLRRAVGTRSLDVLLADKEALGPSIENELASHCRRFGVEVCRVGLRDVILPGEMKTILNQVIEAEKQAQANVIRRREETAAARSQANTAKLIAENPVLMRMREIEALQEVFAGTKATFVLGADNVVGQLRDVVGMTAEREA